MKFTEIDQNLQLVGHNSNFQFIEQLKNWLAVLYTDHEHITLVQFVTDVIHKDFVVLVLSVYYSCTFIF